MAYKGTMPTNTSIAVAAGTKGIADFALNSAANLVGITFPVSLVNIGNNIFQRCIGLTSVSIPGGTTGDSAFAAKTGGLVTVTFGGSITKVVSDNSFPFSDAISLQVGVYRSRRQGGNLRAGQFRLGEAVRVKE